MGTLWQDIRYGSRMLARSPGFAAGAVVILAIGIGATTAMLSIIDAVLLRPPPYEDPDSLVHLYKSKLGADSDRGSTSYPNCAEWRDQSTVFQQVAGYASSRFTASIDTRREWILGFAVSSEYFSLLRIKLALGRVFLPAEEESGGEPVVLISHSVWQN